MATQAAAIVTGMVAVAQMGIIADLINIYITTKPVSGFPSDDVRVALIYALVSAVWGTLSGIIVPCVHRRDPITGFRVNGPTAATSWLLATGIFDFIGAILLSKAASHGRACVDSTQITCHLFTASLVLEWILTAFTVVTMLFSATGSGDYPDHLAPAMRYV